MKKIIMLVVFITLAFGVFAGTHKNYTNHNPKKLVIHMKSTKNYHDIGTITITKTHYGLVFTPNLMDKAFTQGYHGFHIHQMPSCANHGMGAKGHWDPMDTGSHGGPLAPVSKHMKGAGHLGDLPALYFNSKGYSHYSVLAPRLHSLKELKGHSLMLHAGGDNFSDHPLKLGGGGKRMACGVISK